MQFILKDVTRMLMENQNHNVEFCFFYLVFYAIHAALNNENKVTVQRWQRGELKTELFSYPRLYQASAFTVKSNVHYTAFNQIFNFRILFNWKIKSGSTQQTLKWRISSYSAEMIWEFKQMRMAPCYCLERWALWSIAVGAKLPWAHLLFQVIPKKR